MSKDLTGSYSSFEEVLVAMGGKPKPRKTSNQEKLKKQQNHLTGTCKACKQPLTWIRDTNVMVCQNPKCRGMKRTRVDETGKKEVYYVPVMRMVDERGINIAMNLFHEEQKLIKD